MAYQLDDFADLDLSVAMPAHVDGQLSAHFRQHEGHQEDLAFAYWRPSAGATRFTASLHSTALPLGSDRSLHGNAAFAAGYITRVLEECPQGSGIAFLHSHLGPGWQGMSADDVIAERDRLAAVVASRTGLPLVGLTWATNRAWSARFWLRAGRHDYRRRWVVTTRSVGRHLRMSFHPELRPAPRAERSQVATASVWGESAQADLARIHVGIVGLGSVGSIVSEALCRTGLQRITLIDHDVIKERNLDRTLGAVAADVSRRTPKVDVAARLAEASHTAAEFEAVVVPESLHSPSGIAAALDCDVLISCVDRPWPRHTLSVIAYSHLIPVIDGGILAHVAPDRRLVHVDWRIQTVGPGFACLYCLDALRRSDVALDRDGKLDDPDYLAGLSHADRERYGRRNVFAFSLSVAAHEVTQLAGLVSGMPRVGGTGPQSYRAYPGTMDVDDRACQDDCDLPATTALALPLDF